MRTPGRLRDRRVLEEQLTALERQGDRGDKTEFYRGALEALRWVIGGGPGPLTGCYEGSPVSVAAIVRELAAAEDLIYGRPSRYREYGLGLEHALMWAQFATAAPPLPVREQSGWAGAIREER